MRIIADERNIRLQSENWIVTGDIFLNGKFVRCSKIALNGRSLRGEITGPLQLIEKDWILYVYAWYGTSAFIKEMEK